MAISCQARLLNQKLETLPMPPGQLVAQDADLLETSPLCFAKPLSACGEGTAAPLPAGFQDGGEVLSRLVISWRGVSVDRILEGLRFFGERFDHSLKTNPPFFVIRRRHELADGLNQCLYRFIVAFQPALQFSQLNGKFLISGK